MFTTYAKGHVEQVWVKRRLSAGSGVDVTHELFGAQPATVDLHPIAGVPAENCTPQQGVPGPWSERLPHFKMGFTPSSGDELQSELFVAHADTPPRSRCCVNSRVQLAPLLLISEIRTIAADSLWMSPHYERDSVAFHFTWRRDQAEVMPVVNRVEQALSAFAPRPHWASCPRSTRRPSPIATNDTPTSST